MKIEAAVIAAIITAALVLWNRSAEAQPADGEEIVAGAQAPYDGRLYATAVDAQMRRDVVALGKLATQRKERLDQCRIERGLATVEPSAPAATKAPPGWCNC